MKKRFKDFFMIVAESAANMSRATRLKVGAVIVKDGNIISFSWNGTPAGVDNTCEDKIYAQVGDNLEDFPFIETDFSDRRYKTKTKPTVVHAELNAIFKLAKSHESGENASMFITHAPCIECSKGIFSSGIKKVYYRDVYRSMDGIEFLEQCGIKVEKILKEE